VQVHQVGYQSKFTASAIRQTASGERDLIAAAGVGWPGRTVSIVWLRDRAVPQSRRSAIRRPRSSGIVLLDRGLDSTEGPGEARST
jgi:hypothetical protein